MMSPGLLLLLLLLLAGDFPGRRQCGGTCSNGPNKAAKSNEGDESYLFDVELHD